MFRGQKITSTKNIVLHGKLKGMVMDDDDNGMNRTHGGAGVPYRTPAVSDSGLTGWYLDRSFFL